MFIEAVELNNYWNYNKQHWKNIEYNLYEFIYLCIFSVSINIGTYLHIDK